MADQELSWMERNNLTTGKLAAIVVLSVVFVTVFIIQLGPLFFPAAETKTISIRKPKKKSKQVQQGGQPQNGNGIAGEPRKVTRKQNLKWPEIELEEVVRYDPFRLPGDLRQAMIAARTTPESTGQDEPEVDTVAMRREQLLRQLLDAGVDVVILDSNRAVASVGGLELHVGDVIEGLRVKSISRKGIELVVVDEQSSSRDRLEN